jgi:SAM-dependent methyltransferase
MHEPDPPPTTPPPDSVFTKPQIDSAYPPGIEAHGWNLGRNFIIGSVARSQKRRFSKLLEVGAGTGIVTAHLLERGVDCYGCDPATSEVPMRAMRTRFFLGQRSVDLPAQFRASVDALAFFDVLEHLADPVAFLDEHKRNFPRVRFVLITLPARQELFGLHDQAYGHYKRYALKDTVALLKTAFPNSVVRANYFFHAMYPVLA